MSFIACGAGQAGNQILGLTARYMGPLAPPQQQQQTSATRQQQVQQPGYAFVDSEPKVVRPLRTPGDPLHLPFATPDCVVFDQNGRGNNWAWGYTGAANHRQRLGDGGGHLTSARGDTLAARALAAVRKQAEACDSFDSLMLVHSLGGGTGSGLGSRLLELAREAYPSATLLSACVAPFSTGDTPLQWYNTVLTLATAHEVADGVLLFDNADLLARAGRLRSAGEALYPAAHPTAACSSAASRPASAGGGSPGSASGGARVSTTDLNNVVAQCLAGVLLPTRHRKRLPRAKRPATGSDDDGGGAGADGRPAWVSVAPAAPEAAAFHNPYAEEGEGDDDGDAEDGGAGAAALLQLVGRPLVSAPFDALAFVQDLVPAPAYKYIDVRSAAPLQSMATLSGGGRHPGTVIPEPATVAWTDLAEMIVDTLPRADRGGRPVTTLTSRLVARGASQADCDAVDPSLSAGKDKGGTSSGGDRRAPAGGSGPGRPGRGGALPPPFSLRLGAEPAAAAWRGLPTAPDWNQVALRLSRAQAFSSALPPDRQRTARLTPGPVYTSPLAPLPQPRSLTLASNSTAQSHLLATAVSRVRLQASVGAYVHWYDRFGITAEHIAVAADSVADVVDAYGALAPAAARR